MKMVSIMIQDLLFSLENLIFIIPCHLLVYNRWNSNSIEILAVFIKTQINNEQNINFIHSSFGHQYIYSCEFSIGWSIPEIPFLICYEDFLLYFFPYPQSSNLILETNFQFRKQKKVTKSWILILDTCTGMQHFDSKQSIQVLHSDPKQKCWFIPKYVFAHALHHGQDATLGQFLSRVQLVMNSVFFLLVQSALLFTYNWSVENKWIHVFLKGISVKWNANSLI